MRFKMLRGYLSEVAICLLTDQTNDLSNRQRVTEDGRIVVRFQQHFQGIPVFGGELDGFGAGNNILVNGSLLPRVAEHPAWC